MKRAFLNFCASTALFAALACGTSCTHVECDTAQIPSAAEILGYPEESGQELVYSTGFENPAEPEIKLGEGFRFAPGEGNNGNGGLRGERLEKPRPETALSTIVTIPPGRIKPGVNYRVTLSVKGKNLRHVSRPVPPASHRFLEVFYSDSKTGARSFENRRVVPFAKPPEGDEFQNFSCTFPGIEGADTHLRLMVYLDFMGTIWFDDLRVFSEGVIADAFLVEPACATFFTDSGCYRIKVYLPGQTPSPAAVVEFLSGGKVLHRQTVIPGNGFLTGDFGKDLPKGEGTIRVILADREKKVRLKTVDIPVFVREREKMPAGACTLDPEGFLLKDGKRFLPLGLFLVMPPDQLEEHLQRLGASPYNFVTFYSALSMAPASDKEKIGALRKGLDNFHVRGLKVLFPLLGFYQANSNYVKHGWSGETTTNGMTGKLARSLRDHPAILGWYLTDELSAEHLAVPIEMRRILNREDPYHPTFTLTNLESELPNYAHSGDIVIVDPYPLSTKAYGSASVKSKFAVFSGAGQLAGTPIWSAPQGFSWGTQGKNLQKFHDYIDPSEEDMRSMMLLSLLNGAKGICMYVYPFCYTKAQKDEYAKYGLQNYPEDMWQRQIRAGAAVRMLEPYFISSQPVPEIWIENRGKAEVKARLWRTEDGKTALVIVGTGGGEAEAVITVPGCDGLKSEFGHTENLGEGKYRFTSKDLASDILSDRP